MFRAGRHARYVPWSPEERGPGSGAPHLAWGPLPAPSKSEGGLEKRRGSSLYEYRGTFPSKCETSVVCCRTHRFRRGLSEARIEFAGMFWRRPSASSDVPHSPKTEADASCAMTNAALNGRNAFLSLPRDVLVRVTSAVLQHAADSELVFVSDLRLPACREASRGGPHRKAVQTDIHRR